MIQQTSTVASWQPVATTRSVGAVFVMSVLGNNRAAAVTSVLSPKRFVMTQKAYFMLPLGADMIRQWPHELSVARPQIYGHPLPQNVSAPEILISKGKAKLSLCLTN
jgi:hypothetical protein